MTRDHAPRDTALMEPSSSGDPTPQTPTHRMRGFWPLMVLIIGGTLLLVLWATLATGTTTSQPELGTVSDYTGDWKDLIGSTSSTGTDDAATTYTGDWKDQIGSTSSNGSSGTDDAPTYTGDWKDSVGLR
jgi:hypothetical protein